MNGFYWWLAEGASRLLEPAERDAVRDDLAESGESGLQALFGLLGLVARRQAAWWRGWRPWPALAGLAPLGLLLTQHAAHVSHLSAIYLWMYVDNWRMADIGNSGYWWLMTQVGAPLVWSCILLMAWSWAGGMAVGVLARRTIGVNGVLFYGALALAAIAQVPHRNFGDDRVFALAFYRVVYPLMVQSALVMLPALWGMTLGRRSGGFRRG